MALIDDFLAGKSNRAPVSTVAGPRGMAPAAERTMIDSFLEGKSNVSYEQRSSMVDMTGTYREWYTGRNLEGTSNGWNTDFQQRFVEGYNAAAERGAASDYFSQDNAVGVVTWDGAKDAKGNALEFGDVVVDGEKQANVYQDFDNHTANVMMSQWLPEVDQSRANAPGKLDEIKDEYDKQVSEARRLRTEQVELAPRAREFEENVEERAEDENLAAIVLTGAGGGAATGAGVGAALTAWLGPGAAIGGLIGGGVGAIAGGVGAWMNQDALAYQAARSREIVDIARKDGADAEYAVMASQLAQNFQSIALNPLGNIFKGGYDLAQGGGFDASTGGAYMEMDEEGRRKAGGVWQALEHVTLLADSALMFASPAARAAYTASMGTQIAAGVAGLVPGVGQFDDQRLEMNSVWMNEDGNFDWGNSLAGIGSVGIDAVQLGGMRGLLRQSEQWGTKLEAAGAGSAFSGRLRGVAKFGDWRDQLFMGSAKRQALREGGETEVRAGMRFVFDKDGNLVGKGRSTLSVLAPSEALQSISAKALARREIAKANGAIEAEALYRAATDLALGARPMQSILVNAFGEGAEELAQGFLDPISQDHVLEPEAIYRGAAAGFFTGAGMGAANVMQMPTQDRQMFGLAQSAVFFRSNGEDTLTKEEWDAKDAIEKRALARSVFGLQQETLQAGFNKLMDERTNAVNAGVIGAAWYQDQRKQMLTTGLQSALPNTDISLKIVQMDDANFRTDAVMTSGTRAVADQEARNRGMEEQYRILTKEFEKAKAKYAADPQNTVFLELQQKYDAAVQDLTRMKLFGDAVLEKMQTALAEILDEYDTGTEQGKVNGDQLVNNLNRWLQLAYDRKLDWVEMRDENGNLGRITNLSDVQRMSLAKAVSRITTRHPADTKGSWHSFVPQLSYVWTQRRSNGQAAISQITLSSFRGDFDGDRVQFLQQMELDDAEYTALRAGTNKLGAERAPVVDSTKSDKWIVQELAFATHHESDQVRAMALNVKDNIEGSLRRLYGQYVPDKVLTAVVKEVNKVIDRGGDVRSTLLEQMQLRAQEELAQMGADRLEDQIHVLANIATAHLQNFQAEYAATQKPAGQAMPPTVGASRFRSDTVENRGKTAATKAASMFNLLPGGTLFRMFQALNHNAFGSPSLYNGWASTAPQPFQSLVRIYKSLSSNKTQDKMAEAAANDDLAAGVLVQLRDMANDPRALEQAVPGATQTENMAVLANMRVPQFVMDTNDRGEAEARYTGDEVTLAQQLLYMELQEFKRAHSTTIKTDQDVAATVRSVEQLTRPNKQGRRPGNAEAAFVHVFNAVKLHEILGPDALPLGSQYTVGQFFRQQLSLHPTLRDENRFALRGFGEYQQDKKVGIPYDYDADMKTGNVTAFRTVVDSVFSAADSELSVYESGEKKGQTYGRLHDKNERARKKFRDAHTAVRKLLALLSPDQELTAAQIAAVAGQNQEFGMALLNAIPKNARDLVLKGVQPNGTPDLAEWFFEVFATNNAAEAEAIFIRNYWLQPWWSSVAAKRADAENKKEGQIPRRVEFHTLKSRMHQVMYRLAERADSTRYELFIRNLAEMTDVDEFMKWVNSAPGINLDEVTPLLSWVDDVADFAPDKSGGGWTKTMSLPMVTENIAALQRTAERMVSNITDDQKADIRDSQIADAIDLASKQRAGLLPAHIPVPPEAQGYYEQMQAVLDQAKQRRVGTGPRAMLLNVAIAAYGIYDNAHNKGITSEHLSNAQVRDVQDSGFGFLTTIERLFGDLTSHTEDSVAQSPDRVARDGGRMMTAAGLQSIWEDMTVETLIPWLKDPDKRHMIRALLASQVIDLDGDNVARRKLLFGRGLEDLLNSTSQKDLFNDDGMSPKLTSAMKFLSTLESRARAKGGDYAVQHKLREMVLAWTTTLKDEASIVDIQDMTAQAAIALADVMMEASRTRPEMSEEGKALASLAAKFESLVNEPFKPGGVQFHGDFWDTRANGKPMMLDEMERLGLPRDEDLADELREYIRGGGSLGLGTQAVVDKFPRLSALALQGPQVDVLYRTQADWLGDNEVGDIINGSERLLSWSTDEAAAKTFNAGANQLEVRGANGLPLGPFTPHKEVLTRGKFRIVEIDKSDPYNIKAVVEHIPGTPTVKEVDPAHEAWEMLSEAAAAVTASEVLKLDINELANIDETRNTQTLAIMEKFQPEIRAWRDAAEEALTSGDTVAYDELFARARNAEAQMRYEIDRLKELLRPNILASRIATYGYDKDMDETEKQLRQDILIKYVQDNRLMLQAAGEAYTAVQRINEWTDETATWTAAAPRLVMDDKEWQSLSDTIVSLDIARLHSDGAATLVPPRLPPKPKDHQLDKRRFMDPSFSFLVDFLSPEGDNVLLETAREMAIASGKPQAERTATQLRDRVRATIFADDKIGRWTPSLAAQMIEGHDQIAGASSVPGVAMAGLLSERWGAAMLAARRQLELDTDPATDSQVTLDWHNIWWGETGSKHRSRYHDVKVRHPNGQSYDRPFQQINKRFVRAATVSFTTPQGAGPSEPNLMTNTRATTRWTGSIQNPGITTGQDLREIDLERTKIEIERMVGEVLGPDASQADIDRTLRTVKVQLSLVHPDTQPTETYLSHPGQVEKGKSHYGSVWYDGLTFDSGGDVSFSALAMLFYGGGGVNEIFQQHYLDTRKTGAKGIEDYDAPSQFEVLSYEEQGEIDFARMLNNKTRRVMETVLSGGKMLPPSYYNAVYKLLKMMHWVDVKDDDGNWQRLTAEQVISWQLANPGQGGQPAGYPGREAQLWLPSYDVLATMLEDPGFGGVRGVVTATTAPMDLDAIPRFEGWSAHMEERFPVDKTTKRVDLSETALSDVQRMGDVTISYELDPDQRSRFQRRQDLVFIERESALQKRAEDKTIKPKKFMRLAVEYAAEQVGKEDVTIQLSRKWQWAAKVSKETYQRTRDAVTQYAQNQAADTGNLVTGWIYKHNAPPSATAGVLSWAGIGKGRGPVVAGDFVVIDVRDFRSLPVNRRHEIDEVLEKFSSMNATVMFVSGDGFDGQTAEYSAKMRDLYGYQRYRENSRILVPDVLDEPQSRNVASTEATLTSYRGADVPRQRLSLLTAGQRVEENTMWIPVRKDRRSKFESVQVVRDMVPLDVYARYGGPMSPADLQRVRAHIHGLDKDGQGLLVRFATQHLMTEERDDEGRIVPSTTIMPGKEKEYEKAKADFLREWKVLVDNIDRRVAAGEHRPLPREKMGPGTIIPLLGRDGELMLYRQGYEVDSSLLAWQAGQNVPGNDVPRNVVMASGQQLDTATVREGTVVRYHEHSAYGWQVELEIDVELMGEKIEFELNGMKYLLTDLPPTVELPDAPILGTNQAGVFLDGVASLHDAISKEAMGGVVNGFGNAFAVFGMDFMPYLSRFFGGEQKALDILSEVERFGNKASISEINQAMLGATGQSAQMNVLLDLLPMFDREEITNLWEKDLWDPNDVDSYVARAFLMYLMSPNAKLKAVLDTTGLLVDKPNAPGASTQIMPALFTQAFDVAPKGSAIHRELMDSFRAKLGAGEKITAGPMAGKYSGWTLDDNWVLTGTSASGKVIRGQLQFGEAMVADENPNSNALAFERKTEQSASIHQQWLTTIGTGGQIFPAQKKLKELGRKIEPDRVERRRIWSDLNYIEKTTSGPASRWQQMTAMEIQYGGIVLGIRYPAYRKAMDFSDTKWEDTRDEITQLKSSIGKKLGLTPDQYVLVDYWLRQKLFRPAPLRGQENYDDQIQPDLVVGALREMREDVEQGWFPTHRSRGPSQLSQSDLSLLFAANMHRSDGWAPRRFDGDKNARVASDNYGQWVSAAFGHAFDSDTEMDPIIVLDMDGFLNTYRPVLQEMGKTLDISFHKDLMAQFLDPRTNELMTVSTSPMKKRQLMEQMILPALNLSLEDLEWGIGTARDLEGRDSPKHWTKKVDKRVARYRAKNRVRPLQRQSTRDFLEHGERVLDDSGNMHSLQRIVIALRHGTAMLNPGLYVSMPLEQMYRGYISQVAAALEGNLMSHGLGRAAAKTGVSTLDVDQVNALDTLFDNLGKDGSFRGILLQDMLYMQHVGNDDYAGKTVAAFEKFAQIGNIWQDPTRGVPQKALARRYVEALWRSIEATPLRNTITFDSMVASLTMDPAYFQKHHKQLHQYAINAVADFRSLKQTPFSLAARWVYEPLSNSSNLGARFAGTLLKLPMMYANYNMNVLTTITGSQGYVSALAQMIDNRRSPAHFISRVWKAAVRGETPTKEDDRRFDMSTAIEATTLANAFIRGGVTQTGLFTLGMLSGSLFSLAGEDEEERRRRRLVEAQNAPHVLDPRRLENDFRNKDMVFLDWLPDQFSFIKGFFDLGNGRSGFQMNWIMKQFISPIIGMERFFQTGDFGWVTSGFADAVGSLPLFNPGTWDDAVRTAHELEAMAAEQSDIGTPTAQQNAMWLLVNGVGIYERMLFENLFLNALYTGFDPYDRDPAKRPLLDSDGTIQRTIENNPRPNDLAVQDFVNDQGEVQTGYQTRDFWDRQFATISENNVMAMLGLSLFTGFQNGYNRYSQPVKMHEIKFPEMTKEESIQVLGTILNKTWEEEGVPRQLSLEEMTSYLKGEFIKRKDWDAYNNLDAIAAEAYQSQDNPDYNALSVLDEQQREEPTSEAVRALIRGLNGGSISLDDPAIRRFGIPDEMREQIQKEWTADTIQEGLDMGLTRSLAEKRAKRLFYGPYDDPAVQGFGDVLWDRRIPSEAKLKYKQLNTTYVIGPDGYPWATGFKRGGFWQTLGAPKRPNIAVNDSVSADQRLNTTDLVAGINTGLRGLVPFNETENIPTDVEIGKSIEETIRELKDTAFTPFEPYENSSSSGGGGYRKGYRSGRWYSRSRGYSSGGGSGYSPTIYWTRQPSLPRGTNIYGDSVRNIFWDNTNQRRFTIRRERVQSSRGRLKQWQ